MDLATSLSTSSSGCGAKVSCGLTNGTEDFAIETKGAGIGSFLATVCLSTHHGGCLATLVNATLLRNECFLLYFLLQLHLSSLLPAEPMLVQSLGMSIRVSSQ